MYKKYRVKLSPQEREKLSNLTRKGEAKAREITHARVLLLADENRQNVCKTEEQIAALLAVSLSTIHRLRRRFVDQGLHGALEDKPRCGRPKQFSGRDAAHVTALACSDPPEGYARWSMRLLADKLVELDYVSAISHQSVYHILKKTRCRRT